MKRSVLLTLAFLLMWVIPFGERANAEETNNDLIIVNKKTNKLAFFQDGELVKEFPVATGKTKSLTPEGKFKIVTKIKNRPYYKEKIPGGDPRNPLGDRWLGLEVNGTEGTTYGIHGNNNEKSIGKYVSAGCIRMHNDDIHWLFPKVKMNTTVIITSSSLSFNEIAQKNGYQIGTQVIDGEIVIDGKVTKLSNPLIRVNNRIFVPLREIVVLLGEEVHWNNETQLITILTEDRTITHKPLSNVLMVDGTAAQITSSRLLGQTVMFPLANLAVLTGYEAKWDSKTNQIIISTSER
ncbi:L,D-transpeptidase family protein [Paenibacillus sediminis]|uniref:L,D-TPase catalytic domain-containing protein n=1 Tax=Paenibacillus sediminis TaxID=664909 RepID=A0ABS4H1H9_9BACL|nr:L,D-transpeptidase family protein [Paenibacillus sediminis]MBP1936127.1 hypothetical protein [Paenibacillus sediminis]